MNFQAIRKFALGPVLSAILGLMLLPLLSWYFPVDDIGRLGIFQVLSTFVIMVFTIGLDQAYVREYFEETDKAALLKTCLLPGFTLLISILSIAYLMSFFDFLFDFTSGMSSVYCIFSLLAIFAIRFFGNVMRLEGRGLSFSISQISHKLAFLILVSFWTILEGVADFDSLLRLFFIASLFSLLVALYNISATVRRLSDSKFNKKLFFRVIAYSWPIVLSGLFFWMLTSADRFFLKELASYQELGVYSMAVSFAGGALVLQSIFSIVWAPSIYKLVSDDSSDSLDGILSAVRIVVFLGISSWLLFSMFSPTISYFLPEDYEDAYLIFLLSLSYPMLYLISEVCGIGLGITRKTKFILYASISAFFVNLALNLYLIPLFGAKGAAIASAVAFLVFLVVKVEAANRLWFSIPRRLMYGMVLCILLEGVFCNYKDLDGFYVSLIYCLTLILWLFLNRRLVTYHVAKVRGRN